MDFYQRKFKSWEEGVLIEELALDESNQVNHLGDICGNYYFIVCTEAPQLRWKFSGQEGQSSSTVGNW